MMKIRLVKTGRQPFTTRAYRIQMLIPARARRRFLQERFSPSGMKIVHGRLLFFIHPRYIPLGL
jgi:hypothetical protein